MDVQDFPEELDSSNFQPLPSLGQSILSDECYVQFPMVDDYKENEEDGLFQSSTDAFEEEPELEEPTDQILEPENSPPLSSESQSDFEMSESGSTVVCRKRKTKVMKKPKNSSSRKKDQNMCKKYNVVAQNVVGKKLKLDSAVEEFKHIKHRQDFFLVMIMSAKKAEKLDAFKKNYKSEIQRVQINCKQLMKHTFKESPEYKKNQALLDAIERSFECISLYEEDRLEDAINILFDLKNLRNKKFIEKSTEFVCAIHRTINNF